MLSKTANTCFCRPALPGGRASNPLTVRSTGFIFPRSQANYHSFLHQIPFYHPPTRENYFTIPQTGPIPKPEKVVILMKQLQDIVRSEYPSIALDAMSTSILTELYGQLTLVLPVENYSENQKQIYLDIMDYIKTNISRNIKITEIAAAFGYNEKYISHRFAQICGIPLKQYILKTKMDTASFMLIDTNEPITEIAKAVGFSDSHNFSRTYKKLTGLSPSEYRNTFSKRMLFHV